MSPPTYSVSDSKPLITLFILSRLENGRCSQNEACDYIGLLIEAEDEAWAPFPLADILPDVKQEFKDLVRDKIDLGTQLLKGK